MRKPKDPRQLAVDLLARSICHVRVAAVIADNWGIYSWGVNNSGRDGYGEHAEAAACRRSNRSRNGAATLYVAAQRKRNGKVVIALPCPACQQLLISYNIHRVVWRDRDETWKTVNYQTFYSLSS